MQWDISTCLPRLASGGCLERWQPAVSAPSYMPNAFPIYVAHARKLQRRRAHIEQQLQGMGATTDVTFVLCADADVISGLAPADYNCLHPHYTRTEWSRDGVSRLPNGTLSLALKHRLAHFDVARRGLRKALVVEDDAVLPANLWYRLAHFAVPSDAAIFFAGSYSRSLNPRLTLADSPVVAGTSPPVHRRRNGSDPLSTAAPHIVGTVAYVLYATGARALSTQPVRAESDVDLSLIAPTAHCRERRRDACVVAAPQAQYGPSKWLVWQDESLSKELTHGQKNSVRDGWVRACLRASPHDAALLKLCRRFRMPSPAADVAAGMNAGPADATAGSESGRPRRKRARSRGAQGRVDEQSS